MSTTLIYSRLAEQLEPEGAFVYLGLAREATKRGIKVLSFGIGRSDFTPPQEFLRRSQEGY